MTTEDTLSPDIPPDAQVLEFDAQTFIEKHPEIAKGPGQLLAALQEDYPQLPREACAVLAVQFVELSTGPLPGHEEAYLASIEWLKDQQGEYKVEDRTGGELAAAKAKRDWRQG